MPAPKKKKTSVKKPVAPATGDAASAPKPQASSYLGGNFSSTVYSPARRIWYGSMPQDQRKDMTAYDRLTMVQKSRYAEKNYPPAVQAGNDLVTYVVGDGITATSHASSPENAKLYTDYYTQYGHRMDITGRFSDAQVQAIIARTAFYDGEIFLIKVRDKDGNPKVQLVETHRVGNPKNEEAPKGMWDGCQLGQYGEIVGWNIYNDDGTSRFIKNEAVMQVANITRSSAVHGIPALQHVLSSLQDQTEIFELEKKAVKDVGDVTRVLTKTGGAIDESMVADLNGLGQASGGSVGEEMGGKMLVLEPGEDMKVVMPNRPSPAWTGFNAALERAIAQGVLPYEFTADPTKAGGASMRLIAAKADRFMGQWQTLVIEQYCNPMWAYVIGDAIAKGELPEDPNWMDVSWTTPKSVSVDAGRDSANDREDLRMGLISFTELYKRRAMDYRKDLEQKCQDMRFAHDMAAKYGLDVEEVVMIARNSFLNIVPESQAPASDAPPTA